MRRNCSSDLEKLLKFEAEGQEFAKILRAVEQFIQTVKGQNNVIQYFVIVLNVFEFLVSLI